MKLHCDRIKLKLRFESSINKDGDEKNKTCWFWTRSLNKKGYGSIKVGKKTLLAHQVSYLLYGGKINKGDKIVQECGNKHCVKFDHLKKKSETNKSVTVVVQPEERFNRTLQDDFLSRLIRENCWTLNKNLKSFDSTYWLDQYHSDKELSFFIFYKRWPAPSLKLINLCLNNDCVNPEHLVEDTFDLEQKYFIDKYDYCEPEILFNEVKDQVLKAGYPFFRWNDGLIKKALDDLDKEERVIIGNNLVGSNNGVGVTNAFHPQMDFVKCKDKVSPYELFDKEIDYTIESCIGRRNSITESYIRSALFNNKLTQRVSNFKPSVTKMLLKHFKPKLFLDFSMGWGGRMLGAISEGIPYIGIDPSTFAINGNTHFLNQIKRVTPDRKVDVTLIKACAEDILGKSTFKPDFIMTSPPYFNIEQYSYEKSQSFIRYPEPDIWYVNFLKPVINGSYHDLENNGHLLLNINNEMLIKTIQYGLEAGFKLVQIYTIALSSRMYHKEKFKYKLEPLVIFRKD